MPVATVAGEAGGIETKHGADLAGAQSGDETLEAGALDGAAGRAADLRRALRENIYCLKYLS